MVAEGLGSKNARFAVQLLLKKLIQLFDFQRVALIHEWSYGTRQSLLDTRELSMKGVAVRKTL